MKCNYTVCLTATFCGSQPTDQPTSDTFCKSQEVCILVHTNTLAHAQMNNLREGAKHRGKQFYFLSFLLATIFKRDLLRLQQLKGLNKDAMVETEALYHMVFVLCFIIAFLKIISSHARSVLPG